MFRFSRLLPGFVRVVRILPVKCTQLYGKMTTEPVIDKRIPDKWRDYKPCGVPIKGERIIAFKTPLSNRYDNESERDNGIKLHERFTPKDLLNHLNQKNMRLGMVVDFTNTHRYYDGRELFNNGILYRKIKCVGKEIPNDDVVSRFKSEACTFLAKNTNSDDLIGVHCTHGLNRAGYIVCRYLIECKGYTPEEAIEAFNTARGYPMERENYLEDLKKKTPKTEVSRYIQKEERRRREDTSFDKPRHFHTSTESFTRHAAYGQERINRGMAQYSRHQNEYHDFKTRYYNEEGYQPKQSGNYASRRFSNNDYRDRNYHNSASNYDNKYHNHDYYNSDKNYHNYDDFNYSRKNYHNYDSGHRNYNNYASYGYDDYQSIKERSHRQDHVTRNRPSSSRDRPKPYSRERSRR